GHWLADAAEATFPFSESRSSHPRRLAGAGGGFLFPGSADRTSGRSPSTSENPIKSRVRKIPPSQVDTAIPERNRTTGRKKVIHIRQSFSAVPRRRSRCIVHLTRHRRFARPG